MTKEKKQERFALAVALTLFSLPVYMMTAASIVSDMWERQKHPQLYRGVPPGSLEIADWILIGVLGLTFVFVTIYVFCDAAKNKSEKSSDR